MILYHPHSEIAAFLRMLMTLNHLPFMLRLFLFYFFFGNKNERPLLKKTELNHYRGPNFSFF